MAPGGAVYNGTMPFNIFVKLFWRAFPSAMLKIFQVLREMHPVVRCSFRPSIGRFDGPASSGGIYHCGDQTLFFFLCRNVSLRLETAPGFVAGPCRSVTRRYHA
jgi:hypothetical protein